MKVLILTQYFPPETGAPQNRLYAIAEGMTERGVEVTVLTGMPNYPEMRIHPQYRGALFCDEQMGSIRVLRAWLYSTKRKNIVFRLLNYFSFVMSSCLLGLVKGPRADIVITESPPLFLGITGLLLAKVKGAAHVFNVSDLWPESAVQLGIIGDGLALRMSEKLEMLCYRRSEMILGQTKGIVKNITTKVPDKPVRWVPNGADLDTVAKVELDPSVLRSSGIESYIPYLVYAGVLGYAQGLETLVDAAELLASRQKQVHLLLIGSGPEESDLREMIHRKGLRNIHFLGRLDRIDVLTIIKGSVASIVPLKKNDLFLGAIPSKIFECLAMAKPIVLGVNGEAKELFIDEATCGLHFEPESSEELAACIEQYLRRPDLAAEHGAVGAKYVRELFDRRIITAKLIDELRNLSA